MEASEVAEESLEFLQVGILDVRVGQIFSLESVFYRVNYFGRNFDGDFRLNAHLGHVLEHLDGVADYGDGTLEVSGHSSDPDQVDDAVVASLLEELGEHRHLVAFVLEHQGVCELSFSLELVPE